MPRRHPGVDEAHSGVGEMACIAGDELEAMNSCCGREKYIEIVLRFSNAAQGRLQATEHQPHRVIGRKRLVAELLLELIRPSLQSIPAPPMRQGFNTVRDFTERHGRQATRADMRG